MGRPDVTWLFNSFNLGDNNWVTDFTLWDLLFIYSHVLNASVYSQLKFTDRTWRRTKCGTVLQLQHERLIRVGAGERNETQVKRQLWNTDSQTHWIHLMSGNELQGNYRSDSVCGAQKIKYFSWYDIAANCTVPYVFKHEYMLLLAS